MTIVKKTAALLPRPARKKLNLYYSWTAAIVNNLGENVAILFGKLKRMLFPLEMPVMEEGVLLNLGCGRTDHPKFVNIDGFPHNHVHFVNRIDRLSMFNDESVDLIYASHCLEHFKYRDTGRVLLEWSRVLKKGGILRLSVPDFDKLLAIYADTGSPDDIVEQLMGGQDNRYNFHYVVFNKRNLADHLEESGFENIREWEPGSSDLATFDDFSVYQKVVKGKNYPVSLNLEARKT